MKNSEKNDRSEFDKSWKDAFEDASIEPSQGLWGKIDGVLANGESAKYKKRLIFYKYVAAASILLLVTTGLLSYYLIQKAGTSAGNPVAMEDSINNDQNTNAQAVQEENFLGSGNGQKNRAAPMNIPDANSTQATPDEPEETNALVAEAETLADTSIDSDELDNSSLNHQNNEAIALQDDGKFSGSGLAALSSLAPKKLKPGEINWDAYHMYLVPTVTHEEKPLENDEKMILFAGLNFTPGYFDPNIKAIVPSLQANAFLNDAVQSATFNSASTQERDVTSGSSYAFGFDMGVKLKERWVIETGLQYFVNNSNATANAFVEDHQQNKRALYVTTAESNDFSYSRINISSPIPLNNSFQFASIPLKLGYMILDKKLSIMVSSGVSSEFFLRNEVSEENNRQASVTIRPGDNSPYNSVYFNGLASARFSYHFSDNYSFSLEPSYRMAISSFAKASSRFTSAPQSLGIAAGLKFYFR